MKNISAIFVSAFICTLVTSCSGGGLWSRINAVIDPTSPQLVSYSPSVVLTDLSVTEPVILNFSENVDLSTVTASTLLVSQDGNSVAGSISISGSVATFTPSASYIRGIAHPVDVSVTTGISDLYGNPLNQEYSFSFSTVGSPCITAASPSGLMVGGNITSTNKIQFTFNEDIDISAGTVTFTDPAIVLGAMTWNASAKQLTVPLDNYFTFGSPGTVTLSGFKASADGASLGAPLVFSYQVLPAWQDIAFDEPIDTSSDSTHRNYQLLAADRLYAVYVNGGDLFIKAYDTSTKSWVGYGNTLNSVNTTVGISCDIVPNGSNPDIYMSYADSLAKLKIAKINSSGVTDLGFSALATTSSQLRINSWNNYLYLVLSNILTLKLYSGASLGTPASVDSTITQPFALFSSSSAPLMACVISPTLNIGSFASGWAVDASSVIKDSSLASPAAIYEVGAGRYSTTQYAVLVSYQKNTGSQYEIGSYNYDGSSIPGSSYVVQNLSGGQISFDAAYSSGAVYTAVRQMGSSDVTVYSAGFDVSNVINGWSTLTDFGGQDSSIAAADSSTSDPSVNILNMPLKKLMVAAYPDTSSKLKVMVHSY